MKKYALIFVHVACASVLVLVACSDPVNTKIQGTWHAKDGVTKLNITGKNFIMDDGEAVAEDYFMKGDTIYTSFEGNQPYTNFVIKQVNEHYMKLMGPDSVSMEYSR